jgi:phosphatidylserine/phosphatidylglycerophosphate/cardiolipin synthase-like enzyme
MITGSSNFSISGLRERLEINVIFRDDTFNKGKKFFEELWDKSVPIVGPDNLTEFMNNVVEKVWMDKLPKPFTIYLRVLDEYFSIVESEIKSKTSLEPVLK